MQIKCCTLKDNEVLWVVSKIPRINMMDDLPLKMRNSMDMMQITFRERFTFWAFLWEVWSIKVIDKWAESGRMWLWNKSKHKKKLIIDEPYFPSYGYISWEMSTPLSYYYPHYSIRVKKISGSRDLCQHQFHVRWEGLE
jgi:hypothetical protein